MCNEPRDDLLDQLDQQLMSPDVVTLGKRGLDYTGFRVNHNCQKNMLKQLVRMAKFGGFPVFPTNCFPLKSQLKGPSFTLAQDPLIRRHV